MIKPILNVNDEESYKFMHKDIKKDIDADVLCTEIPLDSIQSVITDLKDTLKDNPGLESLCANQIGYKKAIFVAKDLENPETINVYIDPAIIKVYPNKVKIFTETCASLSNMQYITRRYNMIKVTYYNEFGQYHKKILRNVEAAMFQHEIDHLYGIFVNSIAEN